MRELLDAGVEPATAASMAHNAADALARGGKLALSAGNSVTIELDPEKLDLP
jgi:hypothetical protein